jgi:hypothetical protein
MADTTGHRAAANDRGMRQEFSRYIPSWPVAALGAIFGLYMTRLFAHELLNSGDMPPSGRASFVHYFLVFAIVWCVVWTAVVACSPLWRKRSKRRPIIVIDDNGLWLRQCNELMHWSEIRSVEWKDLGQDARFTVVWKHMSVSINTRRGILMDGDDKVYLLRSVYKLIKLRWEQCRDERWYASDAAPVTGINPAVRQRA